MNKISNNLTKTIMFGRKKVEPVATDKKDWQPEVEVLQKENKDLIAKQKARELEIESEKKILKNELSMKIIEATQKHKDDNYSLKEENATLKKEVEILRKAFENMGFDVKDMKAILDKLVDGIVSKNTINLVK